MRRLKDLVRQQVLPSMCPRCRKILERKMLNLEKLRGQRRKLAPLIEQQRRDAVPLVDDLLKLPQEKQVRKIQLTRHRLRSRPVAEELLLRSRQAVHHNPYEAVRLAELAREVALTLVGVGELAALSGGQRGILDLMGRCLAFQANGYRVACDFETAKHCFSRAEDHLNRGTGDQLLQAEILSLRASLVHNQRQFHQAIDLADRTEEIYIELEETHLQGRLLVKKAGIYRDWGHLETAVGILIEACKCIDEEKDPRLAAIASTNLAEYFCQLGKPAEANVVMDDSHERFHNTVDSGSTLLLYREWTAAKVAWGLGNLEEAEDKFIAVKEAWADLENSYNSALVSLDLAEFYTVFDRLEDVAAIAEETAKTLEVMEMHREALQAVYHFFFAAKRRQNAVEVIRKAAATLHRYRYCRVLPS
ncbi:MAG: hypothetical protein K0U98_08515 [Deltaproteobacteria bacterium]|nr:hypothetical protein [Deltaproteobacteria bacterium]